MISVCIATYNGASFLHEQIASIIVQLGQDDELIISDNGSTDTTLEIIESFQDRRIKLFKQARLDSNHGIIWNRSHSFVCAASNFENALRNASGDIIFLSDQDDVWYPGRVNKMCKALSSAQLAYCNFNLIDSKGNIIKSRQYEKIPFSNNFIWNMVTLPFFGSAMAFRRSILDRALPFPRNCLTHDNWIALLSSLKYEPVYIPEPLHGYRVHSFNVSHATMPSKNPIWYRIFYRLVLMNQLLCRFLFNK